MEESSGSPANETKFVCPVTTNEEYMRLCVYKRNRKWRGKGSGIALCDCAMNAGKCPAVKMMNAELAAKRTMFFSPSPKTIPVPKDILANINIIVATREMLLEFPTLTSEEAERLTTPIFSGEEKQSVKKTRKRTVAKTTAEHFADITDQPE